MDSWGNNSEEEGPGNNGNNEVDLYESDPERIYLTPPKSLWGERELTSRIESKRSSLFGMEDRSLGRRQNNSLPIWQKIFIEFPSRTKRTFSYPPHLKRDSCDFVRFVSGEHSFTVTRLCVEVNSELFRIMLENQLIESSACDKMRIYSIVLQDVLDDTFFLLSEAITLGFNRLNIENKEEFVSTETFYNLLETCGKYEFSIIQNDIEDMLMGFRITKELVLVAERYDLMRLIKTNAAEITEKLYSTKRFIDREITEFMNADDLKPETCKILLKYITQETTQFKSNR